MNLRFGWVKCQIKHVIPIALQNVAMQIYKFAIACPESRSGVYADHTFQEQTEQSEVCTI